MVERVWGGLYHGPTPIYLSEANFQEFERACGQTFSEPERHRIADAVNLYYSLQSYEWASPQPAAVRKALTQLAARTTELSEAWRSLCDGDSGGVVNSMLADAATDEGGRIAPGEFDSWAADTFVRVEYLGKIAASALAEIPPKRTGGPRDAKGQFHVLVNGLADVYADAAGELHVTYDDLASSYRRTGFLALVDAAQCKLPEEFRYNGEALGKTVQNLVRKIRDELAPKE